MNDTDETLVLRSVNLPMSMDEGLRGLAYRLRCSKSDLIRHFVGQGLAALEQRAGAGRIEESERLGMLTEIGVAAPPQTASSRGRSRTAATAGRARVVAGA